MPNPRSWTKTDTIIALLATILVLVTGALLTGALDTIASWRYRLYLKDPACPAPNQCTITYRLPDLEACDAKFASTNKKCDSNCYATDPNPKTHCDGGGRCVSDNVTACLGYCSIADTHSDLFAQVSSCTTDLFPLQPYWLEGNWNLPDNVFYGGFIGNAECIAQACYVKVLQLLFAEIDTGEEAYWVNYGGFTRTCEQLLDSQNADVDTSCIVAKEFPVDSEWLVDYYNFNFNAQMGGGVGRICAYHYACAAQNVTNFYDDVNLLAASLSLSAQGLRQSERIAALNATNTPMFHYRFDGAANAHNKRIATNTLPSGISSAFAQADKAVAAWTLKRNAQKPKKA